MKSGLGLDYIFFLSAQMNKPSTLYRSISRLDCLNTMPLQSFNVVLHSFELLGRPANRRSQQSPEGDSWYYMTLLNCRGISCPRTTFVVLSLVIILPECPS